MPFVYACAPGEGSKGLRNREHVAQRRMVVARVVHAGRALVDLEREERHAKKVWDALGSIANLAERVHAMLELSKVLDTIRDRRRILLGEPLPGTLPRGLQRRPMVPHNMLVDLRPAELPSPQPAPTDAEVTAAPASDTISYPHSVTPGV